MDGHAGTKAGTSTESVAVLESKHSLPLPCIMQATPGQGQLVASSRYLSMVLLMWHGTTHPQPIQSHLGGVMSLPLLLTAFRSPTLPFVMRAGPTSTVLVGGPNFLLMTQPTWHGGRTQR